jgi:hypothetical protein
MAMELLYPDLTRLLAGNNPSPTADDVQPFQLPQNRRFNRKSGYGGQSQEMIAANPVTPASTGAATATATPTASPANQPSDATDASALSASLPSRITAPDYDFNERNRLSQDVAKQQAPLNNDPALKPRWYDRLIGAAVGGVFGAAGRPGEGAILGGDFVNRRLDRAEQDREQRLTAAQTALSDFDKAAALKHQSFGEQAEAGRLNLGISTEERARDDYVRKVKRDEQIAEKENRDTPQNRTKLADEVGLKGRDRSVYILTGKVPDENAAARIDIARKRLGLEAERVDLAKQNAASKHQRAAMTFRDKAAVDRYSNTFYAKKRADAQKAKKDWLTLNPDSDANSEEAQAAFKGIENQYAQDARQFEQQKKGYYTALAGGKPVEIDENGEIVGQQHSAPVSKSATKDQVRAYAKKKGVSYQQAEAGFRSQGYQIQ